MCFVTPPRKEAVTRSENSKRKKLTCVPEGHPHLRRAHGPRVVAVILLIDGLTEEGSGLLTLCHHLMSPPGGIAEVLPGSAAPSSTGWRTRPGPASRRCCSAEELRSCNKRDKPTLHTVKRLLKDTSIRLTMTRQVSMLKPSVLMSLPVEEEAEQQEGEQLSRNNKASLLPTYAWRQSC